LTLTLALDADPTRTLTRTLTHTKDNGGSVAALAGNGFCVIAADTRLREGYSILARNASRLLPLGDRGVVASAGCWADTARLWRRLEAAADEYTWEDGGAGGAMELEAVVQYLSHSLYQRRSAPYYVQNVVASPSPCTKLRPHPKALAGKASP